MGLQAIVVAAGSGSRFGGRKLLARMGTGLVLEGALRAALDAPVDAVMVVTGSDATDVASAARRFAKGHPQGAKLTVVHAATYETGLSASVRAGLSALPADTDGVFVFLGDMPAVPTQVPFLLQQALAGHGVVAAAPVHAHRRGHPVLFAAALLPKLAALTGDSGARATLDGLGEALSLVAVDEPGILFDIDTRADLARAETSAP
ncbi:nucleotidyltransferase family protein [Microvirga antarctica]|uniref:nucleotidyltransferase family protein n=1 Tax=Microvirga antarctica TaxID=2819233 RepID=UPI001B310366|nr:nucleotidyltransferase family protein [Microvirga antarctica]